MPIFVAIHEQNKDKEGPHETSDDAAPDNNEQTAADMVAGL